MANTTDISVSLKTKVLDDTLSSSEKIQSTENSDSANSEKNEVKTSEGEKETKKSEALASSNGSDPSNENSTSRPTNSNLHVFEGKRLNGVKPLSNSSKINVLGNQLPLTPETWTVTSDSQIWLECCQNSFRACGGNVRSFQPHSSKLNNHVPSPNHIFPSMQGASSCPQGHRNSNANSMNYNRNSQYVVHLHVNPGETISFDMGDHVQLIQGPATVRMVSSNNTPPVPMPVQVPPGHMVQQIVDEHGTLRHIILSPQPPVAVSVGNPYNGTVGGNVASPISGSAPFYLYPHPSYPIPQFPPHLQGGLGPQGLHASDSLQMHQTNGHCSGSGMSESSYLNSFRDERTQRQFFKLKKRLESRQQKDTVVSGSTHQDTSAKSVEENTQNEESNKKSEKELLIVDMLSAVKAPVVANITSTSALLEWSSPEISNETECDVKVSQLQYNLLLCDKTLNSKSKAIYSGKELKFSTEELKPATTYSTQVQAKFNDLTGTPSESISFKTLSCKPEAPQPPKLVSRTKTTISIKWNAAVDNGAKISSYILEYDEGTGSDDFVELFNGLQKQYKAAKLKTSTCYKFRLAAVNEHGQSDFSPVSCFSTSGTSPSQPSPPVLKEAFVNKLSLEWEQRPNDDSYTLQMEDEKTLHGFLPVYNGKETSYTCLRLSHNTSYKFRLLASNDEGPSPWSQIVSYSTIPDRPGKPSKPSMKGKAHSTSFKMTWDPPKEDGGCPISEYILEMDGGDGFKVAYKGEECESTCDNLQPGTSYFFRVHCCSLGGKSDFSDVGSAVTVPVVPGKCDPPKLHGKPKALSIHLRWNHPEYNGGSEIIESEVEITNPDGTSRLAYKGSNTDCVVAGLQPGRMYKCCVRACNKVGAGSWSEHLEVMSGAGAPNAPDDLSVVSRSPHCCFASWSEPFHNGAVITEYRLECKSNDKDFELVYSGQACSAEVKSLTPATMYNFQVQAVNSSGAGLFSEAVSCQTLPSSPGSVSTANIKVTVESSSITLSWKEPNNHGSPILSYNIEVGDAVHTTDGDNPEIRIDGLVPETTYKVRIQAINNVGPGPFSSSMKIVTRGLPPLPPILECCSCSCNSIRLKWGDSKNLDLKTYTLEMESPQSKRFFPVYQGSGNSFKVSKLQEVTSYNFRMYASNEEGDGPYSDVFTFTTHRALPPALKAPKVSSISQTSCCVEWLPAKAVGDDMLSYKLQLGSKECDFNVCYTGIQTCYTVHSLSAGTEYSVRVAAVRHCNTGELPGPFSPCTVFCTSSVAQAETQAPKVFSVLCSLKRKEPLTDQQWAVIILCAFTLIAVCVAIVIQQILS